MYTAQLRELRQVGSRALPETYSPNDIEVLTEADYLNEVATRPSVANTG